MAVTSALQYWNTAIGAKSTEVIGPGGWDYLDLHEVVEVTYKDEVYKPAEIVVTVQNTSASGGVPQLNKSHSNLVTATVVTNANHGLKSRDRVTLTEETSGNMELKVYEVEVINTDTFYLRHYWSNPGTGVKAQGGRYHRVQGDGTADRTLSYVPVGKYQIESPDVARPDFYMGQELILWNIPETFTKGGPYAHDGASPLIINHPSHPYADGKIVQFTDDTQGTVVSGGYEIFDKSTNHYKLKHKKSKVVVNGNGNSGTISTFHDTDTVGFPIFYGTVTDLEERYHPSYGKTIVMKAKDHLQFLANTTAKRLITETKTADGSGHGEKVGSAPRMTTEVPDLTYLSGAGSQQRFSEAVAQIVDDFSEGGKSIIYHDNTNGSGAFDSDAVKFQPSGFALTSDERDSGNFKKDLSDTSFKILRVIQQLGMSDRHTSTTLAVTGAAYGSTDSTSAVTITKSGALGALNENELVAISNDNNVISSGDNKGKNHIPNGIYRAKDVTVSNFNLYTITDQVVPNTLGTGTVDVEGVEDGNFGYDFYLDSGIYGLPELTGYKVAGGSTVYTPRPHLNYFKRGYLQFRPDATGLNIKLPLTTDGAEDGQTRIMYPDANFKIGDDEIVTSVELQASTDTGGTSGFRSDLGHTLEIMRIKGISCKDNVPSIASANERQQFAGPWLGDFHWGRHDSMIKRSGTAVLSGRNDSPMLFKYGTNGRASSGTSIGTDLAGEWQRADVGLGSPNDRLIAARVLITDVGGISTTQKVSGNLAHSVSGYSGLSELSNYGRSLSAGPGQAGGKSTSANQADVATATTGVMACDLIKSVKNIEDEDLLSTITHAVTAVNANLVEVTASAHNLQKGAWIKIITGTAVHADPWMNYYRVVYNVAAQEADEFYLTRLPAEAYEGYEEEGETIPTASDIYDGTYVTLGAGSITAFKHVYNVFNGVARVQYQSLNASSEEADTDNYVLLSDRINKDYPYMGIEVHCISAVVSSTTGTGNDTAGLFANPAIKADPTLYSGASGLSLLQNGTGIVQVRFRKGDKISETRFLLRDDGGSTTTRHLFKNTQAIISENIVDDKNRSKSEELSYSMGGSDLNEVRRTAAIMLTRSSRDIVRGNVRIIKYPYIKLTGQAQASTSSAGLKPEQNFLVYGGRPGMLVTKTDSLDGVFEAGVLAENISTSTVTGTLSASDSWAEDDFYRAYIHLRAGHSVRIDDPRSGMQANMIATKIEFREGPGISSCNIEVIGLKDTATGFPVKPLGKIRAESHRNKQDQPTSVFSLGKAQLKGITFSAG
tara:strand:- start:308 stop:4162 length:3855 start_codon:yes stop_codon:yes gene_type:complete